MHEDERIFLERGLGGKMGVIEREGGVDRVIEVFKFVQTHLSNRQKEIPSLNF